MESRFDADTIERLATINDTGRFEIQFSDADGRKHVVSIPLDTAIALGSLITDVSEKAPYLLGARTPGRKHK